MRHIDVVGTMWDFSWGVVFGAILVGALQYLNADQAAPKVLLLAVAVQFVLLTYELFFSKRGDAE